eukprot:g7546.t1
MPPAAASFGGKFVLIVCRSFFGAGSLANSFWVLSKFRTESQVLQSLKVCQHVQCGQEDIQAYAHFVHKTEPGVGGAGAKRVERIRRSWGWTLKKASVTNPEKYTDPSRLKYLDESHFENWDCSRWQCTDIADTT